MANRKPLVQDGTGQLTELPAVDALAVPSIRFPDGSTQTTAAAGGWKLVDDNYTAFPGERLAVRNDGDNSAQINIDLPLNPAATIIEIADIGYYAGTNPIVVNIPAGNTLILPNKVGADPGPLYINAAGASIRLAFGGGGGAWRLI